MTKICIVGAKGRMGKLVVADVEKDADAAISGQVGRGDDLIATAAGCDVIIDFSPASGTMSHLSEYAELKKPLVVAGTGFSDADAAAVDLLGAVLPLIRTVNLSIGVNLMACLVKSTAGALPDWDIGITELHHNHKKDAPSGTAKMLGLAANCDQITAIRGGDIAGEHTVLFMGPGERIEITHRAATPAIFATGAVRAAKWIAGKRPGSYEMKDVLGI